MKKVIRPKNRDGFALILTVIVVTIVMTVGVAIASISTSNYLRVAGIEKKAQVRAAAESGVANAVEWIQEQVELGQYNGFQKGDTEVDLGEGRTVTYSVYQNTDRPGTENYRVVAKGKVRTGIKESTNIIYADIAPRMSNAFEQALFAESDIKLNGTVKVNGGIWTNGNIGGNSQANNLTGPIYAVGEDNLASYEVQPADEGQVSFPPVYDSLYSKAKDCQVNSTAELEQALANGNYILLLTHQYFVNNQGKLDSNAQIFKSIDNNVIIVAEYYDSNGSPKNISLNKDVGNANYSVGLFSKSSIDVGQIDFYGILYSLGEVVIGGQAKIHGTVVSNGLEVSNGTPTITYSEQIIDNLLSEFTDEFLYSGTAKMNVVRWQEEKN